ncbi:hypothetical protein L7F22_065672 [Adiantum nelumboides]|nr:hypothetical protein [Adiantum nelumboides]
MVYEDVREFTRDQELLIDLHVDNAEEGFDYVEGFVVCNKKDDPVNGWGQVPFTRAEMDRFDLAILRPPTTSPFLYCLEVAKHYSSSPNAQSKDSMDKVEQTCKRGDSQ